jgi:hypothetical protein
MTHPTGESIEGSLRLDFDRRLTLEFHGFSLTSDAELLAYRLDPCPRDDRGCWQFDLSPSKLKQVPAPLGVEAGRGPPTLMLFSIIDDRSGLVRGGLHPLGRWPSTDLLGVNEDDV